MLSKHDLTVDERERLRRAFRNAAFKPGFTLSLLAIALWRLVGKHAESDAPTIVLGVLVFGGFALGIWMGVGARRGALALIEEERYRASVRFAEEERRHAADP